MTPEKRINASLFFTALLMIIIAPIPLSAQSTGYDQVYADVFSKICLHCHDSHLSGSSRNSAPSTVNFDTYESAKASAQSANIRVQAGTMPPPGTFGPLTSAQKTLFQNWINSGTPEFSTPVATGPFNLTINFSGMTPNIGQMFRLRVVEQSTGSSVKDTTIASLTTANFQIAFPKILESGKSYNIDFYIDLNQNGVYDTPPVDHAWRLTVSSPTADVTLAFSPNSSYTDIKYPSDPGPYDLALNFSGMTPDIGQKFQLRVVDSASAEKAADTTLTAVPGADFQISFSRILKARHSYNIDFYADMNNNGIYDPPPADHAWRLKISSAYGKSTLTFTYSTSFTDVRFPVGPGPYNLTINFTGMTLHIGQEFQLRIVDSSSARPVVDTTLTAVPAADFQIAFFGILQARHSYNIDFYVDMNKNGVYDPPPVDYAWRIKLPDAYRDENSSFAHNVDFTDIKFPVFNSSACPCDLNGDGSLNIVDVIKWLLDWREGVQDSCLDRAGDGHLAINDAIFLLLEIKNNRCPEQASAHLAGATQIYTAVTKAEGLSRSDIEFIEKMMTMMNLSEDEKTAFLTALYGSADKSTLPKAFSLGQNTPNPFNPATTISYTVPEGNTAKVTLALYDLRGRLVRTLVDEVREAGAYNVFWDGRDDSGRQVPSGIYFYRMKAGDFNRTRKMILLK